MTDQPDPEKHPDRPAVDGQPEAADQPPPPADEVPGIGRARIALRVSMIVMAVAITAFAYFAPGWVDRGMTEVNRDRLQSIAEDTARNIAANGWTAARGVEYAQGQTKLGEVDTTVDIQITGAAITVNITGTAHSANPFASLTGGAAVNRITVTSTAQK